MAGEGGTAPPGQQPEPLIEPGTDLLDRQRTKPGCSELQSQRDTVQANADRRDSLAVAVVYGEAPPVHRRALGEELHRFERGQPVGGAEIVGRHRQRGNPDHPLPADPQRFPASDQQARTGAGSRHRLGQLGRRPDDVLSVVEYHQHGPDADRVDQGGEHRPSRLFADAQNGGHRARHQLRIGHGASSTSHTPSSARSSACAATCSASRDLPIPPGPVIVISRDPPDTSARSSASSAARPTKLVTCQGRL